VEGAIPVTQTLKTTSTEIWNGAQAAALVVICLLAGTAGGWLIRKSTASPAAVQALASPAPSVGAGQAAPANLGMPAGAPSPKELQKAAEAQAAPVLQQLKADPKNAALLTSVGNIYYDAKQYPRAIEYYEQALKIQPSDASVRTDLGTAYWYTGNSDVAIAEFNKSLAIDPNKADTLFNLGVVKWQGKKDGPGAIAAWQKLLEKNPAYPNKSAVEQLIAQAQPR
jgi:tetratricopeptide (TPR) repeat protein